MIGQDVIAKAVGALLGANADFGFQESVLTFDKFMKEKRRDKNFIASKVDLDTFHQMSCVNGIIGDIQPPSTKKKMEIEIQTSSGKTFNIKCNSTTTIKQLKMEIEALGGFSPDQQRLCFAGRQVEDSKTLGHYKIIDQSTLHLVLRLRGGACPQYIPTELLSPQFDFDFTGVVDTETFTRGSFTYKRPCGWNRVALNVLDKYENNVWIGAHRERTSATSSLEEEWPVSYHGTGQHNSQSIAASGYLLSKGRSFAYGRGIYSTPQIDVAGMYAQRFTYGTQQFLVVVQNRVNPKGLIRIPLGYAAAEYWLTPSQEDIRPYGICIKPLNYSVNY